MISSKIYERFWKKKKPPIQDLQREVNEIKEQIKVLHQEKNNIKTKTLQITMSNNF